jgi:hypothetical protein
MAFDHQSVAVIPLFIATSSSRRLNRVCPPAMTARLVSAVLRPPGTSISSSKFCWLYSTKPRCESSVYGLWLGMNRGPETKPEKLED